MEYWQVGLGIEMETRNGAASVAKHHHLDLRAIYTSSPFHYITAWMTTLHVSRNTKLQWDILDQEVAKPVNMWVTKNFDGEHRWKAVILEGPRMEDPDVHIVEFAFLVVEMVGNCFERVGVCCLSLKGQFKKHSNDDGSFGTMKVQREKITLG
jgi:hypothetical protein